MPARIVVAHDELEFLEPLTTALKQTGHDVAAFTDSMDALKALETAQTIEVLITRVQFSANQPNGLSLARMALVKRPGIQVIFTARPEFAEGLGVFMPMPVSVPDIVDCVERLPLKSDGQSCTQTAERAVAPPFDAETETPIMPIRHLPAYRSTHQRS
jgi:DNA-binding NtrC family response regulator